jgi:hypothetical protein
MMKFIRWLVDRRSRKHWYCYVLCGAVAVWVGLFGVGMMGDPAAALPYGVILILCIVQLFRPMFILWCLLTGGYGAYTTGVALKFDQPVGEFVIFLLIGAIPTALLLWSRPRPLQRLKPKSFCLLTARVNSCPDTFRG